MPSQVIPAEVTFVDQNGDPLAAGLVYMYYPNTDIFSNTYQDQMGTILNSNPIVLDQAGRANIWGTGSYRQVVTDQFGNVQWDQITTAGGSTPVSGDIPGDLTVGGNASIAGQLSVGSGAYINGNTTVNGQFNTLDIVARNITTTQNIGIEGGAALYTNAIQSNGAGTVSFTQPISVQGNISATGSISGSVLTASTAVNTPAINTPVIQSSSGTLTVASNLNMDNFSITNAAEVDTTNIHTQGLFVNQITGNGANPINVSEGLNVSGQVLATILRAVTAGDAIVALGSTNTGLTMGMWNDSTQLCFGVEDGNGNPVSPILARLDTAGNFDISGSFNGLGATFDGTITSGNVYPLTGSTYNIGTEGNTWANAVIDTVFAHDFVTYSTDATSSPLSVACLPLVEAIAVKTAPHVGLAAVDISSIPGALVAQAKLTDGKTAPQGVSYNAVVACLWKALQELNSAFNAYVAAHP